MVHLDLFSGIGGFALACQWNGIETIGFVEIDKYCQKVLRKHWPNVPIVEDIRDVEKIKEIVANHKSNGLEIRRMAQSEQGYKPDGICQISSRGYSNTNSPSFLITAGFPCQPFSVAGKRQGERDDRYLWPQTIAVVKEIKPQWVLLENVTGIINLALDTVLSDLEGTGYAYETLIIPACAVNVWHRRDRVWIIAYATDAGSGQRLRDNRIGQAIDDRQRGFPQSESSKGSEDVANTEYTKTTRQRGYSREVLRKPESAGFNITSSENWWAVEPQLGRVAHGIPHRVDRLKCLGNAIVPQVAYEIIRAIKEIDGRTVETNL